jgi:xanthine dehydrogenase accessory factor
VTIENEFLSQLADKDAIFVTVQSYRGSVPRGVGAWMAVFEKTSTGTVGGGHLEWQAMAQARARLSGTPIQSIQRYALGASLGQCCGGEVSLQFEPVTVADVPRLRSNFERKRGSWPCISLFGGGHVGQSLVRVLTTLPLQVRWIDSRDEVFRQPVPYNVCTEHSDPVQSAVSELPKGALVVVMSFSHAEDLEVVAACLTRQRERADLPFIGLIGSRTKWTTFCHRLEARGFSAEELAHVTCPIGLPSISAKDPEVIAIAVAAQLLQVISQRIT